MGGSRGFAASFARSLDRLFPRLSIGEQLMIDLLDPSAKISSGASLRPALGGESSPVLHNARKGERDANGQAVFGFVGQQAGSTC